MRIPLDCLWAMGRVASAVYQRWCACNDARGGTAGCVTAMGKHAHTPGGAALAVVAAAIVLAVVLAWRCVVEVVERVIVLARWA